MFNISVIIPMYNSKNTIKNTIESVINQTYKSSIEIIVINDGSIDGCEKIVESIILNNQTNRIIKLINKENSGVSNARNTGMKEANGKYISFLDSDDSWHPQKVKFVLEVFENKNIEFLGHNYTLENNFQEKFDQKKLVKVSFTKLLLKNFAVTPSIVIKKAIVEYFDESMSHTEDHELWLRIALKRDVYFLNLPLTTLGREGLSAGGLSSNKWAMRKGELKMYKNIVNYKKSLIYFYPFLIVFSLLKHLRYIIKDLFEKN